MHEKIMQMQTLIKEINDASEAYYGGRGELMTDYEWDAKLDELTRMEVETGIVLEDSPTHKVSTTTETGQKEAHEFPALSLAKTKQLPDLVKWADGRPICVSWKLDGLTLVATYDNGKLSKLVTRGDGHIGTNITHLASGISGIPLTINDTGHMVIRGEAVISYADFEAFRLESGEDYANPRNLASGSMTLKDVEEVKKRHVQWIPFTLVYTEQDIVSWAARMAYLDDLGFETVQFEYLGAPTEAAIQKSVDEWTLDVVTGKNPFPVDGLVITYDDTVYASTGSVTGHHATRAGYAFKWQDESAKTTLDHIEWSCAASAITPVAVFQPVELEGTTVKRASLCNISEAERLGVGGSGTELSVIKANKIIPKVIAVEKTVGWLDVPAACPVCGAETLVDISEVSGTKVLRCVNPNCAAKQLRKFTRFVSKAGVNIDGLSESTLDRFVNEGWVKTYADIYRVMDHKEEMEELDGFGARSVQILGGAIEKARTVPDTQLLYSLCIPLVGRDVSKRLLAKYDLSTLIQIAMDGDDDVFSSIDGIGPEKSAALVRWCHVPENITILNDLLSEVQVERTSQEASGNLCEGLTFVVTGDVHHYKNRSELKSYIESMGGKVTGSVSKSTNYLINNDLESASSKNQKAKQLGIPIISEDTFVEQFTRG